MAGRRARREAPAARREAIVESGFALALLLVAVALPVAFSAEAPPAGVTIALIVSFALASRVEFTVRAGCTIPTQMLFVPVLFLLDPAWAPAVVAVALVLGRVRDMVRYGNAGRQVLVSGGNAWFAVGPALVLRRSASTPSRGATGPSTCWRLPASSSATRRPPPLASGSCCACSRACSCA